MNNFIAMAICIVMGIGFFALSINDEDSVIEKSKEYFSKSITTERQIP